MVTLTLSDSIQFHHSGRSAPNRFLKSAMTERLCTWEDNDWDECGKPTPEYINVYKEWGQSGIGINVTGNIPCDRRYPESKNNAVMDPLSPWDAVESFKPVFAAAKAHGSLVIGQVTHAGRQTSDQVAPTPISSSDVQCPPFAGLTFGKPRAMTKEEIKDVVQRFAFAAEVLYKAGADGIQLHAAHGYLLSQFLSPRINKRTDEYGGASLENRSRIVFEIFDAIRLRVPDTTFILSIKINSADFAEGGFSPEECQEVVVRLEAAGVDLIELSGGTYESFQFAPKESTIKREAFYTEFADRIRPHLKTSKLAVTGGFRTAKGMTAAINQGTCDLVGLGRPLCAEFNLCNDLLSGNVAGAKPNLVNPEIQTFAALAQLQSVAKGQPPADFSLAKEATAIEEALKSASKSRSG